MNTCGKCVFFQTGSCIASGYLGCEDSDLLKVLASDKACETHFEEIE